MKNLICFSPLVFGKWPIMRLDNFVLTLFNSRNATHSVYLWTHFLYKYIQKIFRIFVGLQHFLNTRTLWDWERLLTLMAQIQDGGNENTHNIFRVYTRTSHDILILMFCTSLGQCKVNVGCICWTAVQHVAQFSYGPSFRTKRTLFDYFRRSFESSSTEEFQK